MYKKVKHINTNKIKKFNKTWTWIQRHYNHLEKSLCQQHISLEIKIEINCSCNFDAFFNLIVLHHLYLNLIFHVFHISWQISKDKMINKKHVICKMLNWTPHNNNIFPMIWHNILIFILWSIIFPSIFYLRKNRFNIMWRIWKLNLQFHFNLFEYIDFEHLWNCFCDTNLNYLSCKLGRTKIWNFLIIHNKNNNYYFILYSLQIISWIHNMIWAWTNPRCCNS